MAELKECDDSGECVWDDGKSAFSVSGVAFQRFAPNVKGFTPERHPAPDSKELTRPLILLHI